MKIEILTGGSLYVWSSEGSDENVENDNDHDTYRDHGVQDVCHAEVSLSEICKGSKFCILGFKLNKGLKINDSYRIEKSVDKPTN